MKRPKYEVKKAHLYSGVFWGVYKGQKRLALFQTLSEANDYAKGCVEDDAWHASNRD